MADAARGPLVAIERLTKTFDGHGGAPAVDAVSLAIGRGELFALLGPSGCGKTTLLRMIAGLERPSAGRILIDGQDVTDLAPYVRPTNMMFQSYALFPHMTVAQNVAFGLRQDGLKRAEIARRVAEGLDLVQMGTFARRRPHQLSGGQRQRVALARCLVKRPKVLLLDEPLGALDKRLREQTQFELVAIQKRTGVTFVMVTHDQEEAMSMSTRIAVMDAGRIVQVGTPAEIYEFPRSRLVADFIGSVNLFDGRVLRHEPAGTVIETADAGVLLVQGAVGTVGGPVTIGIRPEKLRIGHTAPDQLFNRARGAIAETAYLGGLSLLRVALDGGTVLRATATNRERRAAPAHGVGDQVWLSWEAEAGVVLPE